MYALVNNDFTYAKPFVKITLDCHRFIWQYLSLVQLFQRICFPAGLLDWSKRYSVQWCSYVRGKCPSSNKMTTQRLRDKTNIERNKGRKKRGKRLKRQAILIHTLPVRLLRSNAGRFLPTGPVSVHVNASSPLNVNVPTAPLLPATLLSRAPISWTKQLRNRILHTFNFNYPKQVLLVFFE